MEAVRTLTLVLFGIASITVVCGAPQRAPQEEAAAPTTAPTGWVVTTVAGSGVPSFADGGATAAQFDQPGGVAVDAAGDVYVADSQNNRIRKITPQGAVTTLAGSGARGSADGPASSASFYLPYGLAVDSGGNVYVADLQDNRIRKVTPQGSVVTVTGSTGLHAPQSVAVGGAGNLFVADWGTSQIVEITAQGSARVVAGSGQTGYADGLGTSAEFNSPAGIAVDSSGNIYVADTQNNRIRKITPGGMVTTIAGSGQAGFVDGPATSAQFRFPVGVTVDAAGNVYVADGQNARIREITSDGPVKTIAGGPPSADSAVVFSARAKCCVQSSRHGD